MFLKSVNKSKPRESGNRKPPKPEKINTCNPLATLASLAEFVIPKNNRICGT